MEVLHSQADLLGHLGGSTKAQLRQPGVLEPSLPLQRGYQAHALGAVLGSAGLLSSLAFAVAWVCSEVVQRMLPARGHARQRGLAEQRGIAVGQRVLIAHHLVQAALADDANPQESRAHPKHGGQWE